MTADATDNSDVIVTADVDWTVSSDQTWCTPSPTSGHNGQTIIKVSTLSNKTGSERTANLNFAIKGTKKATLTVTQATLPAENYVPGGYKLVWSDEFNSDLMSGGKPALPSTNDNGWYYETGNSGWGNNELENYITAYVGTDTCALVSNGTLKIKAKKVGSQVMSIRMNTRKSWTYGYFEARLKLPTGRGTWPAFWMMPKNFNTWPDDGEVDIMEEVGYHANYVSSSIHCAAYNHKNGTQKTAENYLANAQSDFHIYGCLWTADYIKFYVDGKNTMTFLNDGKGDKSTWPFNAAFYLKLNLAWGGSWGGAQGVDESILPATYEVDYVRVYQK
jgi:beta-glucanase (GH16 family)